MIKVIFSLYLLLVLTTCGKLDNDHFQVFPVDYKTPVHRTALPEKILPALELTAARGETETGAFVVRAKQRIGLLKVRVTDFVNKKTGRRISKNSIQIRQTGYTFADSTHSKEIPLFLWPNKPCSLKQGENMQYWITLRAGEDADTGRFHGSVNVKGAGISCKLPVSFYIRPFKLLYNTDFFCGAFMGDLDSLTQPHIQDMKAHQVDAIQFFWNSADWEIRNVRGHLRIEFNRVDSVLRYMKQAGMRGPVVPSMGNAKKPHMERDICLAFPRFKMKTVKRRLGPVYVCPVNDPVFDTLVISALGQAKKRIESYGFEMVLLIYDEPTLFPKMKEYSNRFRLVKSAFPDLRIYGVVMDKLSHARQVAPFCDIIVTNGGFDENTPFAQNQGKAIWFYCTAGSQYSAGAARGKLGFRWMKHAPGAVWFWAYNYYENDPYVLYDAKVPETQRAVVFPPCHRSAGLVVGTPAWEGIREACDDWAYVNTLKKMLGLSDSPKSTEIKVKLKELLHTLPDLLYDDILSNNFTVLDSMRTSVAGWISALLNEEPEKFQEWRGY
jgi:hypothetical protein